MKTISLSEMETVDSATGKINTIIETPRGSRNKFTYDDKNDLFKLSKALPAGAVFPFDFGFIPSTLGADGDPIDVLVLMDEPVFPGVLVPARLIGVIEAEQTEDGKTMRNDRLIAIAEPCQDYENVREIQDLSKSLIDQIEHFFVSYNQIANKKFKPLGCPGSKQARKLMEEGQKKYRERR